jgi:hypothetical protein
MKISDQISLLKQLSSDTVLRIELFYKVLEECGALKHNYVDYAITRPIDCNRELLRLPDADYDTCCALLTMLLREDHFSEGSFDERQRDGEVRPIVDRMIALLKAKSVTQFSELALQQLQGFYVYALIDLRNDQIFYIGKGTGNRVFAHEAESGKYPRSEKAKLQRIQEIESTGHEVKRLILNWGLTEEEAFAAEATLINLMNYISPEALTNAVAGHHVHESLTVEDFELRYGAEHLKPEDIQHNILCIKINRRYHRDITPKELYDAVRGIWRVSMNTIKRNHIEYVFGVYNQLIVAVYKPDEWHYVHEQIDAPHLNELDAEALEKSRNRIYFTCADYAQMDENQRFYLHKSIADLKVNQSAQNPITYLLRPDKH